MSATTPPPEERAPGLGEMPPRPQGRSFGARRLVLVGGGHAHVQVLRDWAAEPVAGVELTVVSPTPLAPYSGMVPGWLAGHYRWDEACIDVRALARRAGARWIEAEVVAFDAASTCLTLADGTRVPADLVSLNVGSTLAPLAMPGATVLPLRPLATLQAAWPGWLQALAAEPARPVHVAAVGGGPAGVECLLAVRHALTQAAPRHDYSWALFERGDRLLPGLAPAAARGLERELRRAGVVVQLGADVRPGCQRDVHLWLWATGARAHPWPAGSGLAVDEGGFVRVDHTLHSVSHPNVMAVGDCAAFAHRLPKSGVIAVRMGPVLSHNLRAALGARAAPQAYRPQARQLALISTGGRSALATWGPLAWHGAWTWRWKDRIDRAFVRRFSA